MTETLKWVTPLPGLLKNQFGGHSVALGSLLGGHSVALGTVPFSSTPVISVPAPETTRH